jgi:hypothetical protein
MENPIETGVTLRTLRLAAIAFFAAFAITYAASAAQADSAIGTISFFGPIGGYNYEDSNRIITYNPNGGAVGETTEAHSGGSNVPSGRMGVQPRLFKGASLCKTRSIAYNGTAAYKISSPTPTPSCGVGGYHSDGFSYAWNGTGYVQHDAKISPTLNVT